MTLRSMFGMVLQDTWLFNGTIRDNIRYGKLDATDEEVEQAAKAAGVYHFIQTLPQGFDTEINEDTAISAKVNGSFLPLPVADVDVYFGRGYQFSRYAYRGAIQEGHG